MMIKRMHIDKSNIIIPRACKQFALHAAAQADLSLCWAHMSNVTFSHVETHVMH